MYSPLPVCGNVSDAFAEAWKKCHEKYRGRLADLEDWIHLSQSLQSPCFERHGFFWHGSMMVNLRWISFEGCYSCVHYASSFQMRNNSLAWCQIQCNIQLGEYFAVNESLCMCDVDAKYIQKVENKLCTTKCEDNGIYGGNWYTSLYQIPQRQIPIKDSGCDFDKRCVTFECLSGTQIRHDVDKCTEIHAHICENGTDMYQFTQWKPWLTSNTVCTNMYKAGIVGASAPLDCNNSIESDFQKFKRWSSLFRVEYTFQDEVSMTMFEVNQTLKTGMYRSYYFTEGGKRKDLIFADGQNKYPSICETDVEQVIDDDRVCTDNSYPEVTQVISTESTKTFRTETDKTTKDVSTYAANGSVNFTPSPHASFAYEYYVVISASIAALLTVIGLAVLYRRLKNKRRLREMDNVEINIRTVEADGNISGPSVASSTPTFTDTSAQHQDSNLSSRNPAVYSFARLPNAERMEFNQADTSFFYRNNGKSEVPNCEVDSCTAEIAKSNPAASNYSTNGVYTEIDAEQIESQTRNSKQSIYGDAPEGVYDLLNASNTRHKRSGPATSYDTVTLFWGINNFQRSSITGDFT